MTPLDDWSDWVRFISMMLCIACLMHLLRYAFMKYRLRIPWKRGCKDEWFIWVIWCVVGIWLSALGIIQESPPGIRPVVILVASSFTVRAIFVRGHWSLPDDD